MAKRQFRKSDVHVRVCHDGRALNPAINVKVHSVRATDADVVAEFGCSYEQAEKALEMAFACECDQFWEYWGDRSGDYENGLSGSLEYAYFPHIPVTVYCEGRSGGWLVVEGLPDVEAWDAVMVSRWAKFQKNVLADIEYRISKECLLEDIRSNEWWKEHSQQYNFVMIGGKNICLADVKADITAYALRTHGIMPY